MHWYRIKSLFSNNVETHIQYLYMNIYLSYTDLVFIIHVCTYVCMKKID